MDLASESGKREMSCRVENAWLTGKLATDEKI